MTNVLTVHLYDTWNAVRRDIYLGDTARGYTRWESTQAWKGYSTGRCLA